MLTDYKVRYLVYYIFETMILFFLRKSPLRMKDQQERERGHFFHMSWSSCVKHTP